MVTTTLMGVGLLCYIVDGFLRTYTAYSIMPRPSFVWMHKWNMAMSSLQEKIAIPDLNTNAASRRMCGELPVSGLSGRQEGAAPALFYAFPSARSGKSESGSLRFPIPGDKARQFPDQTKNTKKSGDRARQFPATNPRKNQAKGSFVRCGRNSTHSIAGRLPEDPFVAGRPGPPRSSVHERTAVGVVSAFYKTESLRP